MSAFVGGLIVGGLIAFIFFVMWRIERGRRIALQQAAEGVTRSLANLRKAAQN